MTSSWVWFFLSVLLSQLSSYGQDAPPAPCGNGPRPLYAELDRPARVKFWSKSDFGGNWVPPDCLEWTEAGFSTLVTTGARFRHPADGADLLRRIGAISQLAGTRYWSTTHHQWQTLILSAYAVAGLPAGRIRADFTPDELSKGQTLYFEQEDNLAGKVAYRMHISESSPDHIVFNVENISVVRRLLITILRPGDMQSVYFLDRESAEVWRFFSIVRTGKNANWLIGGNASSSINRAIAFYRHYAGIPDTEEPPAAR